MTTHADSVRCVRQKLDIQEDSVVFPENSSEESSQIVSSEGSIGDIVLEEEGNFSSFAPPCGKGREKIRHAAPEDVSSSETGSGSLKEAKFSTLKEATTVETCHANVSVSASVMGSDVLETDNHCEEGTRCMSETDISNVSLSESPSVFSGECENLGDEVHKKEEIDKTGYDREKEGLNFAENVKGTKVRGLLKAEKKRLMAEIEGGATSGEKTNAAIGSAGSDFFKIGKNGNGCQQKHETFGKMIFKDHSFVRESLKVEVIDDTAVVNVVAMYKKGSVCPKGLETPRADKKNIWEKPVDGKLAKGTRRKGKAYSAKDSELQGVYLESKTTYSRKQMEAMRYAKIADQRKLWSDICSGLTPEAMTEYEGLASLKKPKPIQDRGQPIPRSSTIGILGPMAAVPGRTHLNIFVH